MQRPQRLSAEKSWRLQLLEAQKKRAASRKIKIVSAILAVLAMAASVMFMNLLGGSGDPGAAGLETVDLLTPKESSEVQDDQVLLCWRSVPGADSYALIIDGESSPHLSFSTTEARYLASGLMDNEKYWWKVAAIKDDLYGPFSIPRSFTVNIEVDTPAALSPRNGGSYDDKDLLLKWTSVSGASDYLVQLSENGDYSELIVDERTSSTSYRITAGLHDGATYYWRVMACRGTAWSDWSQTSSFTRDIVVSVPSPTGPSQTSTVFKGSTSLNWTLVEGADGYRVQVSEAGSFSSLVVDEIVHTAEYPLPSSMQEDHTYYWRVQAQQDGVQSEWSSSRNFYLGCSSFTVSFNWEYGGLSWNLTQTIPGKDYYQYHDLARNDDFASYVTDDSWVETIAAQLDQKAEEKGYSYIQKAEFILKFVQSITYALDFNTTGQMEYPRYPVETLVDHVGDCEDVAALYASLMRSDHIGTDAVLLKFTDPGATGHMAAGIEGTGFSGKYFTYEGKQYYYCETTNPSYDIGVYPVDLDEFECEVLPC